MREFSRCTRLGTKAFGAAAFSLCLLLHVCFLQAQEPATAAQRDGLATGASGSPAAAVRDYIRVTWDGLTRSTTDCKSLVDSKVTTAPILYLPAEVDEPAELAALKQACRVEVRRLPRPIRSIAEVKPQELRAPGLLYLPHPYMVPGGRFNEQYGWDSYFIVLGLISDGRLDLARGMVDNFLFEVEHYGALLNANRSYYLTRSQPPLLAELIREVHAASPQDDAERRWLTHAYLVARRDYALWRTREHKAGDTGLARYYDVGDGPVIEMADDSTYYPDAIRWMLAHPAEGRQYLVPANAGDAASCDRAAAHVCAAAEVDGMRLSRDFYKGDRAMRESGFDTSFRFGAFSGSTHHFAPVCLNSLLYRYEMDMAEMAASLRRGDEAPTWQRYASERRAAMEKYLWDEQRGAFFDYDFTTGRRSTYVYATGFYPLWAGLATPREAESSRTALLAPLTRSHGLAMSTTSSGMQWDLPFGWAPNLYFAAEGLRQFGYRGEAESLARVFNDTVRLNFAREGTLREKYNVVDGTTTARVTAGYRSNNAGFGWTNGVYLRMLDLLAGREARLKPPSPQLQSLGNAHSQSQSRSLKR